MEAARLLKQGVSRSEVARGLGVHRQSVIRWARQLAQCGREGLKKAGRAGRKPRLSGSQLKRLQQALKRERAAPAGANLGTARPDAGAAISLQLEDALGRGRHHLVELLLPALPEDHADARGGELPGPSAAPSDGQKKALSEKRTIVFIDESGLKLLVVWDRAQIHRGRMVREFVAASGGRIALEYLPAYAPELNPVEYIWGYWKHHELPNFCPRDFARLSYHARRALKRMRRRPTLVMAFWEQANLFPL